MSDYNLKKQNKNKFTELFALLKQNFEDVKRYKPEASRKDSAELYMIAKKFKKLSV